MIITWLLSLAYPYDIIYRSNYITCFPSKYHMSGIKDKIEDAVDKMKAGTKATGKKAADTDRDTETEYRKEEIKEKLD